MGMGSPVRRGDVQPAVIALLKEQDMHGYQIIQELTERSGGAWNPSPGSIYPTLQMLEDQGMVTSEKVGGKRVFSLTDAGREYAETLPDQAPWDEATSDSDPTRRLREVVQRPDGGDGTGRPQRRPRADREDGRHPRRGTQAHLRAAGRRRVVRSTTEDA